MGMNWRRTVLGGFNPLSLSPLLMLDADNLLGTGTANNPANGASVTAWNDLSGNGNNFGAGSSPTYATNAMHGHNVVTFNGSSQYLDCNNTSGNAYVSGTSVTMFVIASLATTASTNNTILTKGNFPNGGWGLGLEGSTDQMSFTSFAVAQYIGTNIWTGSGTFDLMTSINNDGTNVTIYKNGANAQVFTSGGNTLSNTAPFFLGLYTAGPYYWQGSVNFIWLKYGLLTAAQVALMHGWCKARMGI